MAFERKDNSGALFKNDKKQDGDNRPNYRGDAMVNGVDVWLSAWLKKDKNGNTYMSLAFEDKERRTQHPNRTEAESRSEPPPIDDGIPW